MVYCVDKIPFAIRFRVVGPYEVWRESIYGIIPNVRSDYDVWTEKGRYERFFEEMTFATFDEAEAKANALNEEARESEREAFRRLLEGRK